MTSALFATNWISHANRMPVQLWDHCFTAGPDFLYYFLVSYFIAIK